jgi:hypothetical protein
MGLVLEGFAEDVTSQQAGLDLEKSPVRALGLGT